jgi:hypothetical protein
MGSDDMIVYALVVAGWAVTGTAIWLTIYIVKWLWKRLRSGSFRRQQNT